VTGHSGIVTGDSGHSRKSVTFERNERSRSAGTAGHVQAESAVRMVRKTHLASPTRKSVKSILESGRDLWTPAATEPLALELPVHKNVRGPGYYH
jgi:hypothetical protein